MPWRPEAEVTCLQYVKHSHRSSRKSYTTMEEKAKWMSGQMTKEKYKRFSSP